MILANSPKWIVQLMEAGYPIHEITVGNISSKEGSTQLKQTFYVSEADHVYFKKLVDQGVKVCYQMAPSDAREDFSASFK